MDRMIPFEHVIEFIKALRDTRKEKLIKLLDEQAAIREQQAEGFRKAIQTLKDEINEQNDSVPIQR